MTPLRKQFFQKLDQILEPQGFYRTSSKFHGDRYVSTQGGVSTVLPVSCRSGDGRSICIETQSVGLRLEEVERLIAEFEPPNPLVNDEDYAARTTISVLLNDGLLSGLFRKSWLLETEDLVSKVARQVSEYGRKHTNLVRAKYSDSERTLQVLIRDDGDARTLAGPDDIRAKKAIAMTLLIHGMQQADELASRKIANLYSDAKLEVSEWFRAIRANYPTAP